MPEIVVIGAGPVDWQVCNIIRYKPGLSPGAENFAVAPSRSRPTLLSDAGYKTVLSGKWHVGELEGMRPPEVGFDEWLGWYAAEKEISQSYDKRRYPDLVLDTFKLKAYNALGMGASRSAASSTARCVWFPLDRGRRLPVRKSSSSRRGLEECCRCLLRFHLHLSGKNNTFKNQ